SAEPPGPRPGRGRAHPPRPNPEATASQGGAPAGRSSARAGRPSGPLRIVSQTIADRLETCFPYQATSGNVGRDLPGSPSWETRMVSRRSLLGSMAAGALGTSLSLPAFASGV